MRRAKMVKFSRIAIFPLLAASLLAACSRELSAPTEQQPPDPTPFVGADPSPPPVPVHLAKSLEPWTILGEPDDANLLRLARYLGGGSRVMPVQDLVQKLPHRMWIGDKALADPKSATFIEGVLKRGQIPYIVISSQYFSRLEKAIASDLPPTWHENTRSLREYDYSKGWVSKYRLYLTPPSSAVFETEGAALPLKLSFDWHDPQADLPVFYRFGSWDLGRCRSMLRLVVRMLNDREQAQWLGWRCDGSHRRLLVIPFDWNEFFESGNQKRELTAWREELFR